MWLKVAFSIIVPTLTQPLPVNAGGVISIHCHQLMEESLLQVTEAVLCPSSPNCIYHKGMLATDCEQCLPFLHHLVLFLPVLMASLCRANYIGTLPYWRNSQLARAGCHPDSGTQGSKCESIWLLCSICKPVTNLSM